MNKYTKLKEKHQKEVNEFPIIFAFSNEQLDEGMKKLGVANKDELASIGYGGYIKTQDTDAYVNMQIRINKECTEALKDPEYCYDAFSYELANHEYCITNDLEDTLNELGLTEKEIMQNPMLLYALKRARKDYLSSVIW